MEQAVILSTARTPIGKATRGAFNKTHGNDLAGHAIAHAVQRSGVDSDEIDDVIMGCGIPVGVTGGNIARTAALQAGLPNSAAGTTLTRFCASGLQAVAFASQRIMVDGVNAIVAGGVESISLAQPVGYKTRVQGAWMQEHRPDVYLSMIETAEIVADRYNITREVQDTYSVQSQERTAAAQESGKFDEEIVPLETTKSVVVDKESGETRDETSFSRRMRATAREPALKLFLVSRRCCRMAKPLRRVTPVSYRMAHRRLWSHQAHMRRPTISSRWDCSKVLR